MKARTRNTFLAAIVALTGTPAFSQETAAARDPWTIRSNDAIHQLLADRIRQNGVGSVVGVIEPSGRRIVTYGKSGARDHRPLDGDTVFQIGSVTKVFTGLLLADAVQRGEVGSDDPAQKYLPPGVRMPERGRAITLIDLSKHMSALPSMPTNFDLNARPNPYAAYTPGQLHTFLSTYELTHEPGKQEYSNLGVALLGRLLAHRAGVDYAELLQHRVLTPLGLEDTSITLTRDQARRLAPGHDRFLEPVESWEMKTLPASGSLRSTANDLLEFIAFNLGLKETPLHPAMVYQRTPGRALGWGRSRLGGEDVYGHEGGKEGYRSAAVFNPRTKTGVVILMNARTDARAYELARHLLFAASPLSAVSAPPKKTTVVRVSRKTLESYAGQYRLESGRVYRVARREDHLLMEMDGDGIVTLFPESQTEFFSNTEETKARFEVAANGRAKVLAVLEGESTRKAQWISPSR